LSDSLVDIITSPAIGFIVKCWLPSTELERIDVDQSTFEVSILNNAWKPRTEATRCPGSKPEDSPALRPGISQ